MAKTTDDIERELVDIVKAAAEFDREIELEMKGKQGRPSKFTPEVVTKLVAAFNMGYNDTEASAYAGISRKTFYAYLCDIPDFRNKISRAKIEPNIKAKEVVINAINSGDVSAARWWLERKAADEFTTKPSVQSDIPAELEEHLDGIAELVKITEDRICHSYRLTIYRLREQERVSNQGGGVSLQDETYTQLLELPDSKLVDYVEREATFSREDATGLRELIWERMDLQSEYRELLRKARNWN